MTIARVGKKYRLPDELVAWYAKQATERGVSENLLVTRALEHYREVLPPLPSAPGTAQFLADATAALDQA